MNVDVIGAVCGAAVKTSAAAGAIVVILAAVSSARESQLAVQPTFRAEVNLVEVVAVVTGDDGRSLVDLAPSDFEVLEDGSGRTLVSVRKLAAEPRETITAASAAPAAHIERLPTSTASTDAPAFVLLLDDLDTSPRDSHRVIRTGERALSYVPDSALLSVVTTGGLNGSLLTLEPPGPSHVKQVRQFRGQLLLRGAAMTAGSPSSVSSPCGVGMAVDSLDCADPTRAARRAAALEAAAEILGRSGSRRKVLLWVTQTMGASPLDPEGSRRAQRRALAAALNNDVTVYVLDPRENTGGQERADESRSGGKLRAGTSATTFGGAGGSTMDLDVDDMVGVPLTQLTRETGGRYITMANNLGDLMGRIIEQNSTSYLLVYESPVSKKPGRHRIDIRVKRPGARVSARQGYVVDPPVSGATASTTAADDRLLRRILLGSAPQGQLRLTVHAVPRFATGKSGAVSVTVLVDDVEGDITLPVDVVLATFDSEGRSTNQHQLRLEAPPAGKPLEFTTELPLSRGQHQLRVAAVAANASKTGLVITPVEVIEPSRQLMMAPPIVLQRVGAQVAPTAERRFLTGSPLGVQAEVAGRPVQEGKVAVKMMLAGNGGAIVRTVDAALDAAGTPDRQRATGLVDTTGLAAGAYLLTIEATAGRPDSAVRHAIPIRLDDGTAAMSPPTSLRHSVVAHGPASRHPASGTFVIRSEAEWREFWRHLPTRQAAPDIDFSRVTLFAIVGRGEGGPPSKPVVVSITDDAGTAVVNWRAERDLSTSLSHPFVVVALPMQVTNVRFQLSR